MPENSEKQSAPDFEGAEAPPEYDDLFGPPTLGRETDGPGLFEVEDPAESLIEDAKKSQEKSRRVQESLQRHKEITESMQTAAQNVVGATLSLFDGVRVSEFAAPARIGNPPFFWFAIQKRDRVFYLQTAVGEEGLSALRSARETSEKELRKIEDEYSGPWYEAKINGNGTAVEIKNIGFVAGPEQEKIAFEIGGDHGEVEVRVFSKVLMRGIAKLSDPDSLTERLRSKEGKEDFEAIRDARQAYRAITQ